jgi:Lysyl oxidase
VITVVASCAGSPDERLPDLQQAVPLAVAVESVRSGRQLVFAAAVDNVGRGPLIVVGKRESLSDPVMSVAQRLLLSDGTSREGLVLGAMRYVRSETHEHWHLLDFERYELRDARSGALLRPARKTGFCLGDRYETSPTLRLAGEPPAPAYTGECGRGAPRRLRLEEGISVGWGDDYVPELEGQSIDVTAIPDGRYLLVHRVNPERALVEASYGNNVASVLLELRGRALTVLARCPNTDRCG